MSKITAMFLTLALFAGLSLPAAQTAQAQPVKADSYVSLAKDPKNGIGDNLVDLTSRDKATLFTPEMKAKLMTQAKYLNEYEDDLFQWFRLDDGRIALSTKTE